MGLFRKKKKIPVGNPKAGRIDPAEIQALQDFYTGLIADRIHRKGYPPKSTHKKHIRKLMTLENFMIENDLYDEEDVLDHINKTCDRIKRLAANALRKGIEFTHIYPQMLDTRIHALDVSTTGWCLGIAAYWLKRKIAGEDIFTGDIYSNPELFLETAAPIVLMKNQRKLAENQHLVKGGGVDFRSKNALAYISGGTLPRQRAALVANRRQLTGNPGSVRATLYARLAPRAAPDQKQRDLFLVLMDGPGCGSHAIAFDFNRIEVFDPNFGVFGPRNGSRDLLLKYLFEHFITDAYNNLVDKIQAYRVVA